MQHTPVEHVKIKIRSPLNYYLCTGRGGNMQKQNKSYLGLLAGLEPGVTCPPRLPV